MHSKRESLYVYKSEWIFETQVVEAIIKNDIILFVPLNEEADGEFHFYTIMYVEPVIMCI